MTLQERVAQKVAEKKALESAQEAVLADNENYVNYLVDKQIESTKVVELDVIINKLNAMKPIVTNDGTKYAVHCYPVAESTFGPVGARLMAIATIAGAMFTTERQVEFTALTNIPYLIALDTSHKLGRPAYVTKEGVLVNATVYTNDYTTPLTAVAHSLGLDVTYADAIDTAKLDKWFASAEAKAKAKVAEQELSDSIDDEPFTLED